MDGIGLTRRARSPETDAGMATDRDAGELRAFSPPA